MKPLKLKILNKSRNKIGDRKAESLFRTSQNLRHLMKIKMEFKRQNLPIPSSLVGRDIVHIPKTKVNDEVESIDSDESDQVC